MREFNVITEFKNSINANNIEIYIYKMRVRDFENKHNENYDIVKELIKLNNNPTIIFYEQYIASFIEIQNWGSEKYIDVEKRIITLDSNEKKILERLLLKEIKDSIDKEKYKVIKNSIYINKPVYYEKGIKIDRYFNFDININCNNEIIIGFDTKHIFEYINTLECEIKNDNVKIGDKVKDYFYNLTYEYVGIAPFTISEANEYMGCSIIDYYENKNQGYIVNKLPKDMKAVLVKNNKNSIFPYIPSRLKKVCRFENLPQNVLKDFNNRVKQKTNEKMQFMVSEVINIVKNSEHINVEKINMLCGNIGYKLKDLQHPDLLFGNSRAQKYPLYGLKNFGVYENKTIEIKYFIDPILAKNNINLKKVIKFCDELECFSNMLGVKLDRVKLKDKVNFKEIKIDNEDIFSYELKKIASNYNETTIVILSEENLSKYYNIIKKTFSGGNEIPTQCIGFDTLSYNEKNKDSIFLNILLGIYAKSGIQPWILKEKLNSDCFIGLDVSRENKVNKAGVIQVVGKDGKVLKTKVISASQSGEKIKLETLKEIVFEAVGSYENAYGCRPKHITFHRDGISREELENLKNTMNNLGIEFDYIEITKGINRRIATISDDKQWKTVMGRCYYKDDSAFICTTKPYEGMGMAQPIRIRRVFGSLDIEKIVEDAYKLTFMHVGAINKVRLPITTYYADLSSTYGNRDLIPSKIDTNCLYFI